MKRTTIIIICLLATIFCGSLICNGIFMKKASQETTNSGINISVDENCSVPLETKCHNIILDSDIDFVLGSFVISESTDSGSSNISFPKDLKEYFSYTQSNDTLILKFKKDGDALNSKKIKAIFSSKNKKNNFKINLQIPFSGKLSYSGNTHITVGMHQAKLDTLLISNPYPIEIDKSDIHYLDIQHVYAVNDPTKLTDCNIGTLNIDLDQNEKWSMDNCTVQDLNLSGSDYNYAAFDNKNRIGQVHWIGKNENALLELKLNKAQADICLTEKEE